MSSWRSHLTPRIRKLGAACATVFFIGYGANFAMYRYTQRKVLTAPHCQKALDLLLSNNEAVNALGKPIGLDAKFNFADRRSYRVDEKKKTFWLKLPVMGKLDTGNLYVNGIYENEEEFQVTSMDLSLNRLEKRYRIFELADEDITIRKNIDKGPVDEDELDEDVLKAISKRKWFDFKWFNTNAS